VTVLTRSASLRNGFFKLITVDFGEIASCSPPCAATFCSTRCSDLRHHPADRTRRRKLPRLGARTLGLHRDEPACRSSSRRTREGDRGFPPADRPRDRARGQLFPHLSPLGDPVAGRGMLSPKCRNFCGSNANTILASFSKATSIGTTRRCSPNDGMAGGAHGGTSVGTAARLRRQSCAWSSCGGRQSVLVGRVIPIRRLPDSPGIPESLAT
jgi:hypothetical protein